MADLRISTESLRETGAALRFVAVELDAADLRGEEAAAVVGHPVLADGVRELSSSWDGRRGQAVAAIAYLADAAAGIGGTYEDIETELLAALRGRCT